MKRRIFFVILLLSAFLAGALFSLHTVSFVPAAGASVIQTNFPVPFENPRLRRNVRAREIPVSGEKTWGRKSKRLCLQKKIIERHRKKEGWDKNYIRLKLQFVLSCQKEDTEKDFRETEERVCAGDYFIYQIPKKYSLGEHFTSGEIRRGNHPILRYHRAERNGREILVFTFTEYAILYSCFGEVSGHMILEMY